MGPTTEMETSSELVRATLAGAITPRAASGPLAVHWCASQAGISVRDYTLNSRMLAYSVIRYHDRFRPDAIWLSADTWVTAQAMGAEVTFPGPNQPLGGTGRHLIQTAADIDRILPPDPYAQGRFPLMLEALQLIRAAVGKCTFIVTCFDQYPFSLACALMGIEQVMLKLTDDRPFVEAVMERCREYVVAYARALAEAGGDLLSGGDSPAGLLGPRLYREVALPFEKRVVSELKAATTLPVSLHICGNALAIVNDMARSGADVLELDHQVDIARACREVGPNVGIWGNLDPVSLLARGTPDQVRAETEKLIATVGECGHRRFVVSSGCTLAMETPAANVYALIDTVREGRISL